MTPVVSDGEIVGSTTILPVGRAHIRWAIEDRERLGADSEGQIYYSVITLPSESGEVLALKAPTLAAAEALPGYVSQEPGI